MPADDLGIQPVLCDRCRKAGLLELLSNDLTQRCRSGVRNQQVGLGPVLVADATCHLCIFFRGIFGRYYPDPTKSLIHDQWHLCCYTSLQMLGITYSQQSLDAIPDTLMSKVFAVKNRELGLQFGGVEIFFSTGFILPCLNLSTAWPGDGKYGFTYLGRTLSEEPDWPLVHGWLRDCDEHHSPCRKIWKSAAPELKVFDCQTLTTVGLPANARYVALSYVWGQGPRKLPTATASNPHEEATISDAITAVKYLNERYLWVDRLCIDQSNLEERLRFIKHMDNIYEAAYLTIVALVDNTESGLPGISAPRTGQVCLKMPVGKFIATMNSFDSDLRGSTWNTRAWTYQEFCLSRRCLVFAEDKVYFICRSGSTSEDTNHSPLSSLPYQARRGIDPRRLQLGGTGRAGQLGTLFERHLRAYCDRKLTDESDALDAFRGILSRSGLETYWGVPTFQAIDDPKNLNSVEIGFAHGLAWVNEPHDFRVRRRIDKFPTWSWTSCRDPKQYLFNRVYTGPNSKRLASDLAYRSSNIDYSAHFQVPDSSDPSSVLGLSEVLLLDKTREDGVLTRLGPKLIVRSMVGKSTSKPPTSKQTADICADNDADAEYPWGNEGDNYCLLLLIRQKLELVRSAPPHGIYRNAPFLPVPPSTKRKYSASSSSRNKQASTLGSSYWLMLRKTSEQSWVRMGMMRLSRDRDKFVKGLRTEEITLE